MSWGATWNDTAAVASTLLHLVSCLNEYMTYNSFYEKHLNASLVLACWFWSLRFDCLICGVGAGSAEPSDRIHTLNVFDSKLEVPSGNFQPLTSVCTRASLPAQISLCLPHHRTQQFIFIASFCLLDCWIMFVFASWRFNLSFPCLMPHNLTSWITRNAALPAAGNRTRNPAGAKGCSSLLQGPFPGSRPRRLMWWRVECRPTLSCRGSTGESYTASSTATRQREHRWVVDPLLDSWGVNPSYC